MATSPIPPTDTRSLFRPVVNELILLLERLPGDAWDRPTIAGAWRVRDVAAHLLDTTLRRLSFQRDRHTPPPPSRSLSSPEDLVRFVNDLNAEWVVAARRISPAMLTRLYSVAGSELADFFESRSLDDPALFPVSWAGEEGDAGWLDIGREFTEQWHHQMQIRDAVDAGPLRDPAWLHAVLLVAVRGLPHAYRDTPAAPGTSLVLEIGGEGGGTFTLHRDERRWPILSGENSGADARVIISDDTAWRLLFNGLGREQAEARVRAAGRTELWQPLIRARSVIV